MPRNQSSNKSMPSDSAAKEFWVSSGHHLLDRTEGGGLVVTDDFLKVYFARPELMPPDDACPVERGLHALLISAPRLPVTADEIAAMADADARENWQIVLAFRDHLLRFPTLEAAYLALVREGAGRTPPLFFNQLVHLILRNALDGELDAFRLRAAELFFRTQRLSLHEGVPLLADDEVIEGLESGRAEQPLMRMFGADAASELDILTLEKAPLYHRRSDGFDFVLDFRPAGPGRTALARVIEIWVKHLMGHEVRVEPMTAIEDQAWTWFVGLDQDATRIGNALWHGQEVPQAERERVLALFKLTFADPAAMIARARGKPVYLILATTPEGKLRLKPQNLVSGLPVSDLLPA